MRKYIEFVFILIFIFNGSLYAAGLKKVLILDFNNIENNPNHQYLESSITDAVAKMLKERFAFRETPRKKWEKVARDNYIFQPDFHTKTAALNLGLLAKQDVVISGGYRVYTKKGQRSLTIETNVRILDVSKKKAISEFIMEGPADNRIWDSINRIAERISKEAKSILPNKEEWARLGMEEEKESLPFITNINFGFRLGGFLYYSGWSKYFEPRQPAIGLIARGNIPVIWDPLIAEFDFYYMGHTLKEGNDTRSQSLDLTGDTTNYFFGLFFMYDFPLIDDFRILPKLGGGYVIQSTTVTGEASGNFTNSFPFAGAGFEISYLLNEFADLTLTLQEFVEFEKKIRTYVSNMNIGINLKF